MIKIGRALKSEMLECNTCSAWINGKFVYDDKNEDLAFCSEDCYNVWKEGQEDERKKV